MPVIYFPEVPEYQAFVRVLCSRASIRCRRARGYVAAAAAGEIAIRRDETGLHEAVWFGALVGGFEGRVVRFDADELRLE